MHPEFLESCMAIERAKRKTRGVALIVSLNKQDFKVRPFKFLVAYKKIQPK